MQSSASPGLDYCILRPDSTVGCFSFADIDSVASAVPAGLRARAISVGREHACATTTDDDVVCWGSNSRRQSQVPSDLGKVRDVEASISTTCAITRSNEIRCWGNNESHSWGTAPADGVTRWVRSTIEAACGITDTGKLKCFNVRGISPYYSAWHDFPIWYGGFCGLEPRGGLCQLDWRPG